MYMQVVGSNALFLSPETVTFWTYGISDDCSTPSLNEAVSAHFFPYWLITTSPDVLVNRLERWMALV